MIECSFFIMYRNVLKWKIFFVNILKLAFYFIVMCIILTIKIKEKHNHVKPLKQYSGISQ